MSSDTKRYYTPVARTTGPTLITLAMILASMPIWIGLFVPYSIEVEPDKYLFTVVFSLLYVGTLLAALVLSWRTGTWVTDDGRLLVQNHLKRYEVDLEQIDRVELVRGGGNALKAAALDGDGQVLVRCSSIQAPFLRTKSYARKNTSAGPVIDQLNDAIREARMAPAARTL